MCVVRGAEANDIFFTFSSELTRFLYLCRRGASFVFASLVDAARQAGKKKHFFAIPPVEEWMGVEWLRRRRRGSPIMNKLQEIMCVGVSSVQHGPKDLDVRQMAGERHRPLKPPG